MMTQMHIIHRPHWRWMRSGCPFSIFVSTLPIASHRGNPRPGCSCKITFSCPGHTILTTTFTKIRKIGTITSFVRVVENWNSWFGHKEEKERTLNLFNQIAIINQYFLGWQTNAGYGSEEIVVEMYSIQLPSVTFTGALDAFYEV